MNDKKDDLQYPILPNKLGTMTKKDIEKLLSTLTKLRRITIDPKNDFLLKDTFNGILLKQIEKEFPEYNNQYNRIDRERFEEELDREIKTSTIYGLYTAIYNNRLTKSLRLHTIYFLKNDKNSLYKNMLTSIQFSPDSLIYKYIILKKLRIYNSAKFENLPNVNLIDEIYNMYKKIGENNSKYIIQNMKFGIDDKDIISMSLNEQIEYINLLREFYKQSLQNNKIDVFYFMEKYINENYKPQKEKKITKTILKQILTAMKKQKSEIIDIKEYERKKLIELSLKKKDIKYNDQYFLKKLKEIDEFELKDILNILNYNKLPLDETQKTIIINIIDAYNTRPLRDRSVNQMKRFLTDFLGRNLEKERLIDIEKETERIENIMKPEKQKNKKIKEIDEAIIEHDGEERRKEMEYFMNNLPKPKLYDDIDEIREKIAKEHDEAIVEHDGLTETENDEEKDNELKNLIDDSNISDIHKALEISKGDIFDSDKNIIYNHVIKFNKDKIDKIKGILKIFSIIPKESQIIRTDNLENIMKPEKIEKKITKSRLKENLTEMKNKKSEIIDIKEYERKKERENEMKDIVSKFYFASHEPPKFSSEARDIYNTLNKKLTNKFNKRDQDKMDKHLQYINEYKNKYDIDPTGETFDNYRYEVRKAKELYKKINKDIKFAKLDPVIYIDKELKKERDIRELHRKKVEEKQKNRKEKEMEEFMKLINLPQPKNNDIDEIYNKLPISLKKEKKEKKINTKASNNKWLDTVKKYQKKHGVDYKKAIKEVKKFYVKKKKEYKKGCVNMTYIDYVKIYQKKNNLSFKDAMKQASESYKELKKPCIIGGKLIN